MGQLKFFAAVLFALSWIAVTPASAATPEGEYECEDCHGFLTVKRLSSAEFQVWLGVGGGSCGGEVSINRKLRMVGDAVEAPYRNGQRQCRTRITFAADGAVVTDSCITAEDEENSTCAMLGIYRKRKE